MAEPPSPLVDRDDPVVERTQALENLELRASCQPGDVVDVEAVAEDRGRLQDVLLGARERRDARAELLQSRPRRA